ncbi:S1/P1 nuclease [Marinibactrum halimedae]|uniref:Endonuclease n=1 Tax=Marinibactrum halimedae TaxID=1444977 RepID=A0AA37TB78_9GAMM|nr:S1/P1 nuclease [Marinibactrum halimedae]MCD9458995.1 S1/P1 nuclease [Marinibactrum halimedae]GLS26875.1 endonuclease [Marinibactrum halimedae]
MKKWCLLILMCSSPSVFAWGPVGHSLVCEIAWSTLTEPTKQWVLPIVQSKGYDSLADACNWADEIRREPQYKHLSPMHYVNVSKAASDFNEETVLCGPKSCVIEAISTYQGYLAAKEGSQAEALLLLGHFVGDIHQPLHTGYKEDRGGNDILQSFKGRKSLRLHYVWDVSLLEESGVHDYRKTSKEFMSKVTRKEKDKWTADLSPMSWAEESHQWLLEAYEVEKSDRPQIDQSYIDRFAPVVHERILAAGLRLGEILNRLTLQRQSIEKAHPVKKTTDP